MILNLYFVSTLTSVIAVLLCIWCTKDHNIPYKLVLGVLSSRDHFKEREVIRNTWLKALNKTSVNKRVLVKFIVGSKDCEIPPDYREDIYSCKSENQWNTNLASLPSNLTVGSLSECSFQKYDENFKLVALDFVVKHAVIVTGLSAPSGYSQPSSVQDFVVQLRDLANQNVLVVSAKFQTNKLSSTSCLSTQKVEKYLLPKGFYGTLVVHCPSIHGCLGIKNTHYNMSNHPAIKFVPILRYGYEIGDETDLLGFPAKYFEMLIPTMLHFQLQDPLTITTHIDAKKNKFQSLKRINDGITVKLADEMSNHGDILLVHSAKSPSLPLTDVYRNLPDKLLSFYQWAAENVAFDYIGKTDDDSFVLLENILQVLDDTTSKKSWFGNFRLDVPVARWGKWAELDYTASAYPAFACGGGYVLSHDLVRWLTSNIDYLHVYQGEDVSMGIWLSAILPKLIQNRLWLCDGTCDQSLLVSTQLNSSSIKRMWKNKENCQNPCWCGHT